MSESTKQFASARMPYIWLVLAVAALYAISHNFGALILHRLAEIEESPAAPVLAALSLFALCSFAGNYATRDTPLPSFVVSIALGVAGHELFAPIVQNPLALASLVTGSAAVILFGGGLEMPLRDFLRLLVKIVLLAVPGVLITGFALSSVVGGLGTALGYALAPGVVIVLGAVLASTDPAAIIPVLENVNFKRRATKDLVVAESALNDVVGALLTTVFLGLPLAGMTVAAAYTALNTPETFTFLGTQAGYGLVFGIAGLGFLWLLSRVKKTLTTHYGADQIYFLSTPLIAFAGATAFGGSGFLAAFIAGLLFKTEGHMVAIERFFYQMVDGIAKPVIFLLVGALVDVNSLIAYAPIGIATALIFMFVLRPAMVFAMLGIFTLFPNSPRGLSVRELLFISFVRETGAIPAVLLVTAVSRMVGPVNGLVEIGMWVILLTLVIAPPLTPFVARRLGVAE
ncbi:MAG: cation:proton antiporter [Proteobacteria bacterium]|nr:cation:proton antiporter [Pseudomonadota bacterium]